MAKRRNERKLGKRTLAILLTLIMAFSLFNVTALAAGQLICDKEEHSHIDECYEERTHEHSDECYKTHEHSFGCMFGCRYEEGESYLACRQEENYKELVCGKEAHSHSNRCYKEEDRVDHLDIHIGLTAKYILNGETYTETVELTKEDYTSGRLQITSTGSFRITSTEIYDAGQRRFNGSFAVGTYENPVYYTITLTKDVSFDINGETVTVPMTFSKTVHYWADNICESLFATRGYKNGSWARGEFVGGHMDFKLGASESTGTVNPDPTEPTEPVKHTLTVQKNVAGVTLDAPKTFTFGVYSGNEKIDTVNLTVSAGGTTAIGTTALEAGGTYFVVEEGSPAIEGYELTTSASVGSGAAVNGTASERFTLAGDSSVVFTNTYEEIVIPPVEPEPDPDPVYYDLTVKYVDGEGVEIAEGDVTEDIEEGASYNTAAKTVEGYSLIGWDNVSDAVSGTMDSDKTVVYVYELIPAPEPDPVCFDLTVKYVDGEGVEIAEADVTEDIEEGASYNTAAKTVEGYSLIGWDNASDAVSGTMDSGKTVIYVYELIPAPEPDPVYYDLTVKYVDGEGVEIAEADVTEDIEEGTSYNTAAKTVEGYTFKAWDSLSDTVGGVMDSDKVVVYIYEKVAPPQPPVNPPVNPPVVVYDLTVNYVTEEGVALTASVVEMNKLAGSAYTTEQKVFEGYSFVETAGDAVSGIMDADKTVTYIYSEDEVIVEIPEEDPPLVDIPEEDPPLADIPEDDVPLVDLPDEDVPLADTPKTGDNGLGLYIALMLLSAMGLAWLVLSGRKNRNNR